MAPTWGGSDLADCRDGSDGYKGWPLDDHWALRHLDQAERGCVLRFVQLVRHRLASELCQVWVYGSAARGDMWSARMPMHSDIDLLFLTRSPVPPEVEEELVNETYPLFLECGRQISPQYRTMAEFESPEEDRFRSFAARVREEGVILDLGEEARASPDE